MKQSTPAERRKAQATIEAMAAEIGETIMIRQVVNGKWRMMTHGEAGSGGYTGEGDTLDDAFIEVLHLANGTTPPPF